MCNRPDVSSENYRTTQECDLCGKTTEGTMFHAPDAMGWATPVVFQCDRCTNPPIQDRIARRCKRAVFVTRYWTQWAFSSELRAYRRRMKAKLAKIRRRGICGS